MSIEQVRASIKGSVWRGIAQSGANLSSLSTEQQNRMVDSVTASVLVAVNDVLGEAQQANQSAPGEEIGDEKLLWEGRPFLSMTEHYTLTSERIKITTGLFGKDIENLELIRIQDIDLSQNVSERIFDIGDLVIRGADPSNPTVTLRNVSQPKEVYEILRRAWLEARKRYGLQFREQM